MFNLDVSATTAQFNSVQFIFLIWRLGHNRIMRDEPSRLFKEIHSESPSALSRLFVFRVCLLSAKGEDAGRMSGRGFSVPTFGALLLSKFPGMFSSRT